MESAEDDPVGFAQLRSGSGYHERLAAQRRNVQGAQGDNRREMAGFAEPGPALRTGDWYGQAPLSSGGDTVPGGLGGAGTADHHDTAPFDVPALLDALGKSDRAYAEAKPPDYFDKYLDKGNPPAADNTHQWCDDIHGYCDDPIHVRTHYFGDYAPACYCNDCTDDYDDCTSDYDHIDPCGTDCGSGWD